MESKYICDAVKLYEHNNKKLVHISVEFVDGCWKMWYNSYNNTLSKIGGIQNGKDN